MTAMSTLNTALAATLVASPLLLLSPLAVLLYRRARMEKDAPEAQMSKKEMITEEEKPGKKKVPVPKGAQMTVACTASGGVSKYVELRARDVKKDFWQRGEHWRYAQELGIDQYEDYWWHLLDDLGLHGQQKYLFKDSIVELDVKPIIDSKGSKQILVTFRYRECTEPFREMLIEVPEDKDLESERAWRQQMAHLRNDHGKIVSIKISDLDASDYEAFGQVMAYCFSNF